MVAFQTNLAKHARNTRYENNFSALEITWANPRGKVRDSQPVISDHKSIFLVYSFAEVLFPSSRITLSELLLIHIHPPALNPYIFPLYPNPTLSFNTHPGPTCFLIHDVFV